MADEVPRELHVGYRLVIEFVAQGLRFSREVEAKYPTELVPEIVKDETGVLERYRAGDHDYFEVRQELIYARTMEPVMEPNPMYDMLHDPNADPVVAGAFRPPEAPDLRPDSTRGER